MPPRFTRDLRLIIEKQRMPWYSKRNKIVRYIILLADNYRERTGMRDRKADLTFGMHFRVILAALFAAIVLTGAAAVDRIPREGVVINEVCTSNVTCCKDDNGEYPDWIELYNPTDERIDLSGYVLRKKDLSQKKGYVIPEGAFIESGSYYVFAPDFDMSSDGLIITLSDSYGSHVDRAVVPRLKFDTSYARTTDGAPEWEVKEATCGWENSDGRSLPGIIDGEVTASKGSGFYSSAFELELKSSYSGMSIYYTTDGSDPLDNGILYDGAIRIYDRSDEANVYSLIPDVSLDYVNKAVPMPLSPVDKCTVIRAVAKDNLGGCTDISNFVYFVGYDEKEGYDNMAVISLSADPYQLFSHDDGIMVLGEGYDEYVEAGMPEEYGHYKANFCERGRRSEVVAQVVIFDEKHDKVLDTTAGMRLKGLSSRWDIQKSFAITFHKAVGGKYTEDFCIEGNDLTVHSFALDKCGQDTETKMIDTIMEYCMRDTGCATVDRIPCCVFLDGEYWGFYWLQERFDRSFLADRYDIDPDKVEIYNTIDFDSYDEWPPEDFDRDSLIDYYAANIIAAHEGDWPYMNFRIWRAYDEEGSEYGDGKYRPVIYDMNSESMKTPDFDSFEYMLYGSTGPSFEPFIELYGDEDFRRDLKHRIDKMESDEFEKQKVLDLIGELGERIHDQMILDNMRYTDCSREEAERYFKENVDVLLSFYETRYDHLNRYKEEYLAK